MSGRERKIFMLHRRTYAVPLTPYLLRNAVAPLIPLNIGGASDCRGKRQSSAKTGGSLVCHQVLFHNGEMVLSNETQ